MYQMVASTAGVQSAMLGIIPSTFSTNKARISCQSQVTMTYNIITTVSGPWPLGVIVTALTCLPTQSKLKFIRCYFSRLLLVVVDRKIKNGNNPLTGHHFITSHDKIGAYEVPTMTKRERVKREGTP
jgi:hypothetical protein